MIAPLRRRHRLVFGALTLGLPALLAAALLKRPPVPLDALAVDAAAPAPSTDQRGRELRWDEAGLTVKVSSGSVALTTIAPTRVPDPLLYWSAEPATSSLPTDARLLGPLSSAERQTFALPGPAGQLILYSLGHGEVLSQLALGGSEAP